MTKSRSVFKSSIFLKLNYHHVNDEIKMELNNSIIFFLILNITDLNSAFEF